MYRVPNCHRDRLHYSCHGIARFKHEISNNFQDEFWLHIGLIRWAAYPNHWHQTLRGLHYFQKSSKINKSSSEDLITAFSNCVRICSKSSQIGKSWNCKVFGVWKFKQLTGCVLTPYWSHQMSSLSQPLTSDITRTPLFPKSLKIDKSSSQDLITAFSNKCLFPASHHPMISSQHPPLLCFSPFFFYFVNHQLTIHLQLHCFPLGSTP